MTLKLRTIRAFEQVGVRWPVDTSAAVSIGPAVIQCESDHTIGLVCVVTTDAALMLRHAKLLVLLCAAAGFAEPASDQWIARELIAAKGQARKSIKMVGGVTFILTVDHPPTLIVFKAEEHV